MNNNPQQELQGLGPAQLPWPTGFSYIEKVFSDGEQASLLQSLRALKYERVQFLGNYLKRSLAQFGYSYKLTGRHIEPVEPFPLFLREVLTRVRLALPAAPDPFNQCIVTHYPKMAGVGWHTDAPIFGNAIIGISFGSPCRFQFRGGPKDSQPTEIILEPGSAYLLAGPSRWKFQHQIIPVKAERYSLTFRQVKSQVRARSHI